jgi:hypothetical protein
MSIAKELIRVSADDASRMPPGGISKRRRANVWQRISPVSLAKQQQPGSKLTSKPTSSPGGPRADAAICARLAERAFHGCGMVQLAHSPA